TPSLPAQESQFCALFLPSQTGWGICILRELGNTFPICVLLLCNNPFVALCPLPGADRAQRRRSGVGDVSQRLVGVASTKPVREDFKRGECLRRTLPVRPRQPDGSPTVSRLPRPPYSLGARQKCRSRSPG